MNKKGSLFGSKNQNIKHRETQPYSPHDALLAEWSSLCSIWNEEHEVQAAEKRVEL